MIIPPLKVRPPLDETFLPEALADRAYRALADNDPAARMLDLALLRPDGTVFRRRLHVLGAEHAEAAETLVHVGRRLKFLLWQLGASRVLLAGAPEVAAYLKQQYTQDGRRAFDAGFMGEKVFGEPFSIETVSSAAALPDEHETTRPAGGHQGGCRIGFDLGGTSRKVAAVKDGQVVYQGELPWYPYFQNDPAYHVEGVQEALRHATAYLPRVDAIGGSAAGVYVNNEVRVGSLFRGVGEADFERAIRRMFPDLQARWGGIPFEVANDGEVAALAASLALGKTAVLGISMGTSQAGGHVTRDGRITTWLNELAFAPIDRRPDAPRDEWSGDIGCGVQYFSIQGVARLARKAGFVFAEGLADGECAREVRRALEAGDPQARAVYETVGICFGHAVAHYAEFYDFDHLMLFGGVAGGVAGGAILESARNALSADYPEIATRVTLHVGDDDQASQAQAVAAATLPVFP